MFYLMRQDSGIYQGKSGSLFILLAATVMSVITGCTSDDNADLRAYIKEVKSRPAARIEPIPEFKTYEVFAYSAGKYRDPFLQFDNDAEMVSTVEGGGVAPDKNRSKEALEEYPLDTLKYVGSLERGGENWAIVTSPDKIVHRVKAGNYIGTNYGKIVSIEEDKLNIVELVADGMGGWIEREAALSLGQ